ncbi:PRELI domain-containing protein 2 [Protopterus annectens]|uniref:PRELI domain-containing protein 2 n=1 Tax=Protopterus annectens TaxID=7888 RepID=UPI001CF954FA|nr:PRELI domain-containing protein 2 [Protopterus annectens]
MVITVELRKLYKYPFETVVDSHLNKYPTPLEQNITAVRTAEENTDLSTGIIYRRRIATCKNVIPAFLRQISSLKTASIYLEEESWLDKRRRTMSIKSRCLTWAKYATLKEESMFKASQENPNWTEFTQCGSISVTGIGLLNSVFEVFAQAFLNQAGRRSIRIMETILQEKWGHPFS